LHERGVAERSVPRMQTRLAIDLYRLFILPNLEVLCGEDENHVLGVIVFEQIADVQMV
jgi:hypothetical protein